MTIKIDKGIECPPLTGGGKAKYPFREMEIGDSVFIPCPDGRFENVRALPSVWRGRSGFKFTQRRTKENDIEGIRIWRIADEPKLRAVK